MEYEINGIFPTPVYIVKRDSKLDSTEEKDIEDIITEGMKEGEGNSSTINTYIFNTVLKKIKEFCEQHIETYVENILSPKTELDFYITQSWLNITKPGQYHHDHHHANSIISGVFYISTVENDEIIFVDPAVRLKRLISFGQKEYNAWNSLSWFFPVNNNELILFPSWLTHGVKSNEKATTDRISISFNTFVKGIVGDRDSNTELIL